MPKSRPAFYLGTDIDGCHINAEQLNVRSTDLNQLIGSVSYTEALFHILHGRIPDEQERKLFDVVLVAFHGGFGLLPPTTFVPRIVAGTGVSTAQALASGFLASGPYHVGATEEAMRLYQSVADQFQAEHSGQETTADQLEEYAFQATSKRLKEGKTVGGFGHPLLRKDPRPSHVRKTLVEMNVDSPFFDIYDGIVRCMRETKGVPPNVDGITGAILLHLGFRAEHGTGMFLLARAAAMLAHIIEEQTDMPYQTMKRFMLLPIVSPKIFNADFKKHARRFNKLRDSKTINAVRNVLTRRARREAAQKEQADQAVISEYRSARGNASVTFSESASDAASDTFVAGAHTGEAASPAAFDAQSIVPDELPEECSSQELLSGAECLLSGCLENLSESEQPAPGSTEAQKLLQQALDLVQQAGDLVEPASAKEK